MEDKLPPPPSVIMLPENMVVRPNTKQELALSAIGLELQKIEALREVNCNKGIIFNTITYNILNLVINNWIDSERIPAKSLIDALEDIWEAVIDKDFNEIKLHDKELDLLDEIANGWKHVLLWEFEDEYKQMLLNNKANPWNVWNKVIEHAKDEKIAIELDKHLPELINAIKNTMSNEDDYEADKAFDNIHNTFVSLL